MKKLKLITILVGKTKVFTEQFLFRTEMYDHCCVWDLYLNCCTVYVYVEFFKEILFNFYDCYLRDTKHVALVLGGHDFLKKCSEKTLPLRVPMAWRELLNHYDCLFCTLGLMNIVLKVEMYFSVFLQLYVLLHTEKTFQLLFPRI